MLLIGTEFVDCLGGCLHLGVASKTLVNSRKSVAWRQTPSSGKSWFSEHSDARGVLLFVGLLKLVGENLQ